MICGPWDNQESVESSGNEGVNAWKMGVLDERF